MSKFTVANAALNLLGKKILIVGGTQGIGKATAIEFSKLGASVMILGRSLEKGQQVLGEMSSNKQNPQFFEFDQLDVLNISNVKKFCSRLLDHSEFQQGLDGLVLCAGGLNYGARRVTEEGFEMTFAQNYLSRFALIQGLLPLLSKNGGRVVNCLGANQGSQIYLDDFQLEKPSYLPFFIRAADQYGAMTDAVTKELAKLHGKDINGPMFFHLFPGIVNTQSATNQGFPWFVTFPGSIALSLIGRSTQSVAEQIVYMVSGKEFGGSEMNGSLVNEKGEVVEGKESILQHSTVVYDYSVSLLKQ
ncbi:hypothetical protein BC833DRAFT_568699 [Globomyces pollinis-pini]|nr:hypothetical protein BC833DRAFT_568699 [Globomyces pollinis-pini]